MKQIPGFTGVWLSEGVADNNYDYKISEPISIINHGEGKLQVFMRKEAAELSETQKYLTINYLIAEGFIEVPPPPVDDYGLHPDLP